jgi:DNA primase small subunit
MAASTTNCQSNSEYFHKYYSLYFPVDLIVEFLLRISGHPTNELLLSHREICADYRTEGILPDTEIIKKRWNSFKSASEFKNFLSAFYVLYPRNISLPLGRLHLGAHYSAPCGQRSGDKKPVPVFKEFVVDVDLSDYDNIRSCCEGKTACSKCWIFIRAAVCAIEMIMDSAFDYRRVLWIFSGRRGVHGWFYDEDIHTLSQREREAMVKSINFINPKTKKLDPDVNLGNSNALLVFKALVPLFCEMLTEQHFLISEKGLRYLKDVVGSSFYEILLSIRTEDARIERFCKYLRHRQNGFLYFKIVMELMYPRIDAPVTVELSHLIGCPFGAHLATGNIAIPIEPATFNIEKDTINIASLFDLDPAQKSQAVKKLKEAFEIFRTAFSPLQ